LWLLPLLQGWAEANAKLIKSIPEQFLNTVSQATSAAVQAGTPTRVFAKELSKTYDLTKARGKVIARTETAKLNAAITQQRQQNLGIRLYIFRTSADERVRKSHSVMEGKVCRWDDPTVYKDHIEDKAWKSRASIGGTLHHPGNEYMCRCHSQAVIDLDDLLGAA
jgi:SPP1 gp7 family putative phage head morphogenesis protein